MFLSACLKLEPAVREAVQGTAGAADGKPRAVKVAPDSGKEALQVGGVVPASPSLRNDVPAVVELLAAAEPCLMLVRLADDAGTVPQASDADWALIGWNPDGANAKKKMLCSSSQRTITEEFSEMKFTTVNVTEQAEVTAELLAGLLTTPTQQDRENMMTEGEKELEAVKRQFNKEKQLAPQQLPGLVQLQISTQPDWDEALQAVISTPGKAVFGKLVGEKLETLSGSLLDAATLQELRGQLPETTPCYVIAPVGEVLLVATWLPDGSSVKPRMKCSTFKSSVVDLVKKAAGSRSVVTAQLSDKDDLVEELAKAKPVSTEDKPRMAAAEPKKIGGFKPPPGGFKLPGM